MCGFSSPRTIMAANGSHRSGSPRLLHTSFPRHLSSHRHEHDDDDPWIMATATCRFSDRFRRSTGMFVYRQDSVDGIYRSEGRIRTNPSPPFLGKAPSRIHLLSAFRIRTHFLASYTYKVCVSFFYGKLFCGAHTLWQASAINFKPVPFWKQPRRPLINGKHAHYLMRARFGAHGCEGVKIVGCVHFFV